MGTELPGGLSTRGGERRTGTEPLAHGDRRADGDRRGADDGLVGRRPEEVAELSAGLDALEIPVTPGQPLWRRVWSVTWPVLLAIGVVVGVWELATRLELKPPKVLPSPGAVGNAIADGWSSGHLPSILGLSLQRALLGFLLSVAVGIVLGIVVARVRAVRLTLQPVLTGLQALPAAALVPIAVIWFSASDGKVGDGAIYAVMLLGAAPSVALGVIAGIEQIPPLFHRVGRILGARRLSAARHIVMPAALPGVLSGLKNGWMFAWRALMTAEIITVGIAGIGSELNAAKKAENTALVLGVTLLILAVGVAAERLVFGPAERAVLRRRGLVERTA
jgi:NitT/TauT family transport system permease protein